MAVATSVVAIGILSGCTAAPDSSCEGVPAWQAGEQFGDNTDSNHSLEKPYPPSQNGPVEPEYYYSFYCASYGVELTGKDEAMTWLQSLTGKEFVSLSIHTLTNEVGIETTEPCKMYAEYPEPEYPSNGDSYNAPPAPPGAGDPVHTSDTKGLLKRRAAPRAVLSHFRISILLYHILWITKLSEHYIQRVSISCYNKLT